MTVTTQSRRYRPGPRSTTGLIGRLFQPALERTTWREPMQRHATGRTRPARVTVIERGKTPRTIEFRHKVPTQVKPIVNVMTGIARHANDALTKHREHVEHLTFRDQRGAYLLRTSRMQIALLQQYFTESFTDEEILELYPELTPEDLDIARAFIVDLLG